MGARSFFWALLVVVAAACVHLRLRYVWQESGWVYDKHKGWVSTDAVATQEDYYEKLKLDPGERPWLISTVCDRYYPVPAVSRERRQTYSKVELQELVSLEKICEVLMTDYKRCFYDHFHKHRDGRWGGYRAECDLLEALSLLGEVSDERVAGDIAAQEQRRGKPYTEDERNLHKQERLARLQKRKAEFEAEAKVALEKEKVERIEKDKEPVKV